MLSLPEVAIIVIVPADESLDHLCFKRKHDLSDYASVLNIVCHLATHLLSSEFGQQVINILANVFLKLLFGNVLRVIIIRDHSRQEVLNLFLSSVLILALIERRLLILLLLRGLSIIY